MLNFGNAKSGIISEGFVCSSVTNTVCMNICRFENIAKRVKGIFKLFKIHCQGMFRGSDDLQSMQGSFFVAK
jgi:hypothetical protein